MLAHTKYTAYILGFIVCLKSEFQLLSITKRLGMSCYV